jgi:putative ABC transport system permease protein
VGRDIRLALRRLGATPLFTTFAILSLAAGVAITTAVYSIVDAVFLRGLGIHEPDRLAVIVTPYSGRLLTGTVSEPDFHDVQTAQTSFSHVAASATFVRRLALPSGTEMVIGESVSGSYFATLGVGARLGRTIQPSDDAGGGRVVMLSDTLWRRRFASDPRIVGATVAISGEPFEVIGVVPASFSGPRGWLAGTQFWIPLGTESRLKESPGTAAPRATARDDRRLTVFGRLAPQVTIAAASAEMQTIAARLDQFFPPRFRGTGVGATDRPWRAKTMAAISDDEDSAVRRFGMALVALVGLVLVVACTNLGNLVLARGSTRLRELAVRRAIGASAWRLVRDQCLESVMLAVGGAFASYVMFELLRVVMDTEYSLAMPFGGRTTLSFHPALSAPALTIAVSSLLIALVVFGLEPAIQLTRTLDVRGALAGGPAAGPQHGRRQRLLLRWQVAIAAGFFIIATMFVKYSIAEARHDSGIDLDRIGVAVLNFDTPEWNEPRARRMFDRVLDELGRDPSVEAASLSTGLPFGVPSTLRLSISPLEQTSAARMDPEVMTAIAGAPSMFRTLGVEILRGRGFDDRDGPAAPRVVVLSEFTARQMFGTADVVGRELAVGQTRAPTTPTTMSATIVGVAADTDVGRIFADPRPLAYVPLTQHYQPLITVVARASGSVTNAVGAMREAIRRADPDVAVDTIGTGRSVLAGPFQVLRGLGMTAIGLGAITLLLAMAGLYGIQSHIIANRTREIGVRMSLGATAGEIKRMVLVDGYRPVLDGLIFGLSIGLVGRAIARAYLELDVAIIDPWMLVVTPIPLICAAFFACYLPARRAAAVDPNVALRSE